MTVTRPMEAKIIPREAATLTRRSYMTALRAFLRAAETHPAEIEPLDVAGWKERLKR